MIKELDRVIVGKGFIYTFAAEDEKSYIYKVKTTVNTVHYEVFLKKTTPICIDFEKKIHDEDLRKEIYPKSNNFGVWAWSFKDFNDAFRKMNTL